MVAKIAISMPEKVLEEIDNVADGWLANRSHAIVRIFQEWKQLQAQQIARNGARSLVEEKAA